jgi:glutamate--cysteine ligase
VAVAARPPIGRGSIASKVMRGNAIHPSAKGVPQPFDNALSTVVENTAQLVEHLESGCKAPDAFKLGTEQEMFVYRSDDYSPAAYDGPDPGIRALLESMSRFGWKPIDEDGLPIALSRGGRTITLEPGGQLELAGAPLPDVHQILKETQTDHDELNTVAGALGLSYLALGHQPKYPREELPWMPKARYRIMRAQMPKCGSLGLNMMQSTCANQVTADFADESDMVKKFRVALALQPVVTALFANSPFLEGRFSGYLSYRREVWRHTDPERCGSLPFVFEEGMSFERYTDYALDVPMYFVCRHGEYIDASGLSFRDFLAGRLTVLPGERPCLNDWSNHLTTVFPQVRLKGYLEMRGADAGDSVSRVAALSALWTGLLYDIDALDAAWERIRTWTPEERHRLDIGIAKHGFNTPFRNGSVRDLSLWMLDLCRQGLQRRDCRDQEGQDESCYLEPLQEAAQAGRTFAEELLQRYEDEWLGDIDVAVRAMCRETMS